MSVTLQEYVKATLVSAVLVFETTTVAESVTVKISNPKPSVVETVTVAENISMAGVLYAQPRAAVKLWSKLNSASDVASPQVGTAGSEVGSPTYIASKFGNGIYSNTNDEGCSFPTSANSINNDKGTIEFWAKLKYSPTDGDVHYLFTFADEANGGLRLYFSPANDDFRCVVYSGGVAIVTITTDGLSWSVDDLIHFKVVWDRAGNDIGASKTVAIYVSGDEEASSTTTWNTDTVLSNLYIGITASGLRHSDAIIDNLKTYDFCKVSSADRENEAAGSAGADSILVVDYPILSQAEPSRQISVYDAVSLAEVLDVIIGAERSLSVYDAAAVAEYINITLSNSKISVNDTVSVAEDITASLIALGISVYDATTLAEAITMAGAAWTISVSDSITVAESITAAFPTFLVSVYDSAAVAEVWRAVFGWITSAPISTTWSDVTPSTATWTDVDKPDKWHT